MYFYIIYILYFLNQALSTIMYFFDNKLYIQGVPELIGHTLMSDSCHQNKACLDKILLVWKIQGVKVNQKEYIFDHIFKTI